MGQTFLFRAREELLPADVARLQSGGELWRRLLAVIPADRSLAQMLMYLACIQPRSLETIIAAVLEQPGLARSLLLRLAAQQTS